MGRAGLAGTVVDVFVSRRPLAAEDEAPAWRRVEAGRGGGACPAIEVSPRGGGSRWCLLVAARSGRGRVA